MVVRYLIYWRKYKESEALSKLNQALTDTKITNITLLADMSFRYSYNIKLFRFDTIDNIIESSHNFIHSLLSK